MIEDYVSEKVQQIRPKESSRRSLLRQNSRTDSFKNLKFNRKKPSRLKVSRKSSGVDKFISKEDTKNAIQTTFLGSRAAPRK
jgi:hypothetical protein